MKKPGLIVILLALAGLCFFGNVASAQQPCSERGCVATNVVRVHVGTVLRLAVQHAPTAQGSAVVRSNGSWKLHVDATAETTVRLTLVGA